MDRVNDINLPNIDLPDTLAVVLNNLDEELENEPIVCAPKRYIRDLQNPFEFRNNVEFKRRFSKNSILEGILPKIEEALRKPNNRGLPISPYLNNNYQLH